MPKTLTLNLAKPGEKLPGNLKLNLSKDETFKVSVFWDCDPKHTDDVDIHALLATNNGDGAKITSLDQILSVFNTKNPVRPNAVLTANPNGSFQTPEGGLTHSGDKRVQKNTETIVFNGSLIPAGVNEIPLFVAVFEAEHGDEHEADDHEEEEGAFADIENVTVTITDGAGKVLGKYVLSDEFGEFNCVQIGSIILGDDGWEYAPVGSGFNGDFNEVIGFFS